MAGSANVIRNLNKWGASKKIALSALGLDVGAKMQQDARQNAEWTDRTGMARRGLTGGFYWEGQDGYSYIAHTVEYGIWLELANQGKYGIIIETRDKFADETFKQAERIMNK